ncbi:MAG: glycosyltransferase family 2 protein [Planctomycetota bacterium]|jgi:glycosyltransferase involved in cell wall biosynthesis
MKLSIVVPVLNESESLLELTREIMQSCDSANVSFELIFVDDGSSDGSWVVISTAAESDKRISGIRFRRNFGKAAALTAGMRAADGNYIMMMDADLQDDPAEIPKFIEKLESGFDVVNGWKQRRLDPWHKVYPSKVFNWMIGRLTGLWLHDHNCGLKLFRREVPAEIRIYGELHRFIPVLAHSRGFKVTELPVHHRERQFGHSKYGIRRFLRGFLDLLTVKFLTGFGTRPQHLMGGIGVCLFGLGSLGLTILTVIWLLTHLAGLGFGPIGSRPLLHYSVAALLLGGQIISLGLVAELLVAYTGRDADSFSIAERTSKPAAQPEEFNV